MFTNSTVTKRYKNSWINDVLHNWNEAETEIISLRKKVGCGISGWKQYTCTHKHCAMPMFHLDCANSTINWFIVCLDCFVTYFGYHVCSLSLLSWHQFLWKLSDGGSSFHKRQPRVERELFLEWFINDNEAFSRVLMARKVHWMYLSTYF